MNVQLLKTPSLREKVSVEEWSARVELAYAYRLMEHSGISDLAHNHICVRVPGEPDAFLIKANEAFFEEVTASNLHKYDLKGGPRQPGLGPVKGAGNFHAAIFEARPDINATIHSHSAANIGVSSQTHGLLPINQHALHFSHKIAYHDYHGLEADPLLVPLIIRDLGDKMIAMLRNHGSLVCGKTLGDAFVAHHQLEIACQAQIAALSAGREHVTLIAKKAQDYTTQQFDNISHIIRNGGKDWAGLLRKADRLFPDARE